MMIAHPILDEPIMFSENSVPVLVIENPSAYRSMIIEMKEQSQGLDGSFALSEDYSTMDFYKSVDVITDVFFSDYSSKRFAAKLNAEAVEIGSGFYDISSGIITGINELGARIVENLDFDAGFTPLTDISPVVKILDIKPEINGVSIAEKLLDYMRLMRQFLSKKLFVFNSLLPCLDENEMNLFFKSVFYEKFNVFLIENHVPTIKSEYEQITVIDNDLCII